MKKILSLILCALLLSLTVLFAVSCGDDGNDSASGDALDYEYDDEASASGDASGNAE